MSKEEELKQLREQMMADIVPLVMQSAGSEDRFDILIRIIQSGGANPDVYRRAYEAAKKIEDQSERLDAMMALVDEIDFDVSSSNENHEAAPEAQQAQPAPEETNQYQSHEQHTEHQGEQ